MRLNETGQIQDLSGASIHFSDGGGGGGKSKETVKMFRKSRSIKLCLYSSFRLNLMVL